MGEDRRVGRKRREEKRGRKRKDWENGRKLFPQEFETITIVAFLVSEYLHIFLYSHCFMAGLVSSSCPCLLPELSSTELSIHTQV